MAKDQGYADIFLRRRALVVCAFSAVEGEIDDQGIWSSGFGLTDFDAYCETHSIDADDTALGLSARKAIRCSRLGLPWPETWNENDPNWTTGPDRRRLATAFDLSSDRGLFTRMVSVAIYWRAGELGVVPTRRKHGGWFDVFQEGWQEGHETIELAATTSDAELGQAIRTGLARSL